MRASLLWLATLSVLLGACALPPTGLTEEQRCARWGGRWLGGESGICTTGGGS